MSLYFLLLIISVTAHGYVNTAYKDYKQSSTSLPLFPQVKLAWLHNLKLIKSNYWRKQYTELIDRIFK